MPIGITTFQLNGPTLKNTTNLLGGALQFPATQISSAGVNTLDDYEEGTWTPVVAGFTTAGTGTYSSQVGTYIKIGDMVYINAKVTITNHTGTGEALINNLPFVTLSAGGPRWRMAVRIANSNYGASGSYAQPWVDNGGNTQLWIAAFLTQSTGAYNGWSPSWTTTYNLCGWYKTAT